MKIKDANRSDKQTTFTFEDGRSLAYYGKDADDFKIGDEVGAILTKSKAGNEYIKSLAKAVKDLPVEQNTIIVGEKSVLELRTMVACELIIQGDMPGFEAKFERVCKAVGI
jgi:hypothetical protein